jgi:protease-4
MAENQEHTNKGRGCGFGCMLLAGLFLGAGLLVAVLLMGLLGVSGLPQENRLASLFHRHSGLEESGADEAPYLAETWSLGHGDVKVIRIPLVGTISLGDSTLNLGNANTVLRSIRRATHDPDVQGLILEMNSGGGGITDSDILYKAVQDFKSALPGRAVVTLMGDMTCSGAYYVALASDHIMAHPTTMTGSIGVIFQSYNFKELAAKLGVQDVTVKSGSNKDLLNPFQEVKPEQREMLQKIISAMHDRFMTLVAENRKLPKEAVAPLADGRVFLAEEAVRHRLIDSIGYNEDALVKMAELLKTEAVKVYRYDEELSLFDLFASRPGIGMHLDLKRLLHESANGAKLMYRWSW